MYIREKYKEVYLYWVSQNSRNGQTLQYRWIAIVKILHTYFFWFMLFSEFYGQTVFLFCLYRLQCHLSRIKKLFTAKVSYFSRLNPYLQWKLGIPIKNCWVAPPLPMSRRGQDWYQWIVLLKNWTHLFCLLIINFFDEVLSTNNV